MQANLFARRRQDFRKLAGDTFGEENLCYLNLPGQVAVSKTASFGCQLRSTSSFLANKFCLGKSHGNIEKNRHAARLDL